MAGVVTGVTESETSEPETSDTGEKGKLEPGLRILRDLINKSEISMVCVSQSEASIHLVLSGE